MSDNNSSDELIVDVNTDDLDAFTDLFNGRAKQEEVVEPEAKTEDSEVVEPNAPDGNENNDNDNDEDDSLATENDDDNGDGDEDDGEEETPEPEPKPKPKSRFQERINELTAKAREAERDKEALQRKLDEILSKLDNSAKEEPKDQTTANPLGAPTPEDKLENGEDKYPLGEFDPLYIRDLTRFTIQKETEELRAKEEETRKQKELEESRNSLHTEWQGKLEKARETYEDLDDKNAHLEETFRDLDPAYGEYLANTIMSLDHGPDVLYYLASNIAEAKKIAASGPVKATIALGRIESFFLKEAETEVKKPKVSKAPTPPPVLNKGTNSVKNVAPDTDDLDAFEKTFFKRK